MKVLALPLLAVAASAQIYGQRVVRPAVAGVAPVHAAVAPVHAAVAPVAPVAPVARGVVQGVQRLPHAASARRAVEIPDRSHGETSLTEGGDSSPTATHSVAEPVDHRSLYFDSRYGLSQAQLSVDSARKYSQATHLDLIAGMDSYRAARGQAGTLLPAGQLPTYTNLAYSDAYYTNADAIEDQIDHLHYNTWLTGTPVDRRELRNLHDARDVQSLKGDKFRYKYIDNMVTDATGSNMWNFLSNQADIERRNIDTRLAERKYWQAEEDMRISGNWDHDKLYDLDRRVQVKEGNERSTEMKWMSNLLFDAAAGRPKPTYWNMFANEGHLEAAEIEVEDAEDALWDAERAFDTNPNEATWREMELAELALDAAEGVLMARQGAALGTDFGALMEVMGWRQEAEALEDYEDWVLEHLEDDHYDNLDAGTYGRYGVGGYWDGRWDRTIGEGDYGDYYDDYYWY